MPASLAIEAIFPQLETLFGERMSVNAGVRESHEIGRASGRERV